MELASFHISGAQNCQAATRFLENFCTYYYYYYYYYSRVGYNC